MLGVVDWISVEVDLGDLEDEPLGTKEKFWVLSPEDEHPWLFKFARVVDGEVRGEDWAEWAVHHVAGQLGVPTAEVLPAHHLTQRGIVSRSVVRLDLGERLVHGNSLLRERDPFYDTSSRRENPGYTPETVKASLAGVAAPDREGLPSSLDAFDVWCGYVLLDAWVGGRDRHHENWAIIRRGPQRLLAPSYDHGNALGFQESDAKRRRCIEDEAQMLAWVRKGRSHHFAGRPSLVAVAHAALGIASDAAVDFWWGAISSIDLKRTEAIFEQIPREVMSADAARFAQLVLAHNMRRLVDGYPHR